MHENDVVIEPTILSSDINKSPFEKYDQTIHTEDQTEILTT